ncbi:F-box/LRR-repeat protein [Dirofilaria immitis]
MVKSLFNICLAAACRHNLYGYLADLPTPCKQRLLEFFSSHDQLFLSECAQLVSSPSFGKNLTELRFYLSDQVTDGVLEAIAAHNRALQQIAIIFCQNITDKLTALKKLTSNGLSLIKSNFLYTVDLSSCTKIKSDGIYQLVYLNRNIHCLYLNNCKGLNDQALYDIAHYLGEKLSVLELDFLPNVVDPSSALFYLSRNCPNIKQLSLCRFFEVETDLSLMPEYRIAGVRLRDVDLHGNYFFTLPLLPPTVSRIRLSFCGDEDVNSLINRLETLPQLTSIHLQMNCKEPSWRCVEDANTFLRTILPYIGSKITRLHISLPTIIDGVFSLIIQCLPNLSHLALDVKHINNKLLRLLFIGGAHSPGSRLRSLKLCRLRATYRALFAIARGAHSITDLEVSHISCVDDRFLVLLADNCMGLKNINLNGCRYVTDEGLAALARKCCLKEVRIRATSCTDKSIYLLAQFCPDLEWISYADFSGRPKFSDKALQCLKDSCVQRVIC